MIRSAALLAMLFLLWPGGMASAIELPGRSIDRQLCCTRCGVVPCCCADAYCRKPMPCIPCFTLCRRPNDYCRKPLPCIPCLAPSCCPDDYCRKPLPDLCCPCPCDRK